MWPIDSIIEKPANGYFLRDLIVFNGLNTGGCVSKGFIFQPPDFNNAQISELNHFQDQLSLLLASLSDNQRLQVQWFCDSDYRNELLHYNDETKHATNIWTRRSRNERFARYWSAMLNRQLRRQRLILYISRSIDISPSFSASRANLTGHYEHLLDQLQEEFSQVHETLTGIFSGQGARIIPMTDADHYRHTASFLNPSYAERFGYDAANGFDPSLSIHENCWHSEGNGQSDFGFWMDGYYHSVIALTRWPKTTFPGIIHRLTNLRLLDYTITVNIDPIPVRKEILKEEKAHERVAGDYASEKKLSLLTVMQKKERKISALMQGHTLPFNALFVVRAWDKTKQGLSAKTTAIKNAINSMNSAQYFESSLPSTTKKLFFQTWPGWTWGRYEYRKLYSEHRYLADMLPVNATFTGHLETAEAIYDGGASNLVGIKTFAGTVGEQTPQHAVLLGMSGTGKSVTMCDLLSQTELYYDYTVIIEEGLSYGIYTKTVEPNADPIILQPDGTLTINYLETGGLPLTPLHLSTATALVARMAGVSADEEKQMLRQARIAKYLNQLYEDFYQDWANRHPDMVLKVARHAYALVAYRREKLPPGATTLDAFADFRDWYRTNEDEAHAFLMRFGEGDVLRFSKDPQTAREVRNLAFSYFDKSEYPTHRVLQELMQLEASGADKEQVLQIATLLLPWCRDGNYGPLFDGESNISLTGKIAHFELGYIPESAKELKSAAGFLITNYTRQHIITMPRALRKRNVYEEVARFLDIPEGEKIVKESYAQMRKFNTWNIAIVQQYSRFKESRIRSAVFGNSRQFFMMKQNDRADLEDISQDIALPEITKQTIMGYPLPDQQTGRKYSAFTYYHVDALRPICCTAHNIASVEMLYCSSTSGEHFERRARELKQHGDIIEGIVTHANQSAKTETTPST
ncbi:MAG TPA: TraC family protein [Verrucomicrobiae bacterium]|nr:TraC family protein [Verrucomicrobiae bacterium]